MSGSEKLDYAKTYIEKLTNEAFLRFPLSESPIPVTEFTRRINALIPPEAPIKKLCYKRIVQFLIHSEFLTESRDIKGKIVRRPTSVGETMGIKAEDRGPYTVILYDRNAQRFLIDNMAAIMDIKNTQKKNETFCISFSKTRRIKKTLSTHYPIG